MLPLTQTEKKIASQEIEIIGQFERGLLKTVLREKQRMKNNCEARVEPCWLSAAFIKSIAHHGIRIQGGADLSR